MKKSVFTLLAIAIASVSIFTSCDKNDDGYGQSAKVEAQTTVTSQDQNANEKYVLTVSKKNFKYDKNGTVADLKDFNTKTTSMTMVKDKVIGAFNDEYAAHLYDYQQEVNNQVKKYNNNNAVIVVALKNSKGEVVMEKDIKPGN